MRAQALVLIGVFAAVLAGCTYVDDFMDRLAPIFQMDTPSEPEASKPVSGLD